MPPTSPIRRSPRLSCLTASSRKRPFINGGTVNLTNRHRMTAHNYADRRRLTFYFHHCAISYQGDDRDVSHFLDHRPLKLTIAGGELASASVAAVYGRHLLIDASRENRCLHCRIDRATVSDCTCTGVTFHTRSPIRFLSDREKVTVARRRIKIKPNQLTSWPFSGTTGAIPHTE